jgi:hypothetical protein
MTLYQLNRFYYCYYYSYCGSTAFCWALVAFQFLDPIHSQQDFLDEDLPVAKPLPTHRTTLTQNKRTQYRHHALSGIRTHDPSV